ncbi:DNA-processing protein DprA [Benzoatithermus flavus]|uniref:DNA-processing protein DprA n=1 Tax=Benzoatithermus flavus TaxID=3108223 RepID=A0ABU8XNB8_9PROT
MPDLSPEERLAWLQLARCEGVGPIGFAALLERHGSAKAVLAALRQRTGTDGRPPRFPTQDALAAELAALKGLGGRMLAQPEEDYPALLRVLPDAPPVLAVRGDAGLLQRPAVAIVGARNASGNGRLFARALARELAEAGLVVVSGLARGIDTAAHEGALQAGGATVAVIAAGVDVAYPPENEALMARIAAEAAIVSERPLGAQARAKDFPRRNRVIAGLTFGIVVVEAAPQSGSLITARLAADYGREVMAVPGSPFDPRHKGTNQLLREGAHLVESAADVLAVLQPLVDREPPMPRQQRRARCPATAERPKAASEHPRTNPPEAPDSLAARVAQALGAEPLAVDELIRECDAPAPDVQAALLELELLGRIDRHPGNRVSLRAG